MTVSKELDSRGRALIAAAAADDKKATDIIAMHVRQTMLITDYLVIVTGANNRQVDAITEAVEDAMRIKANAKPIGREGLDELSWVLLDFGDVVVHIFQPQLRDFYRLESLWSDSPLLDLSEAGITDAEYSERIAKYIQGAALPSVAEATE